MKNLKKAALVMDTVLFFITPLSKVFAQETLTLSDAEIASVAVVANQNDIDFANIALQRSHNPKVLEFAKTIILDLLR